MKKILPLLLLLLMAACKFGITEGNSKKEMRIVSLSRHLTEMIFALGKGQELVAIDLGSTYPDSTKFLPTVGYQMALSPEAIIAVEPGLVIHSNDIGPDNVIPQITKSGLPVKTFGNANTIDSAKLVITELGRFFGEEERADSINKKLDFDFANSAAILRQRKFPDTPKVLIIDFSRLSNTYFVLSGKKGPADQMIELAGGKVVQYDAKDVKQISAEAVTKANPDVIIATASGFDKMGTIERFITDLPGVALTNAGKNKRIVRFEEHDLVYFGPRSGANILTLMKLVHP